MREPFPIARSTTPNLCFSDLPEIPILAPFALRKGSRYGPLCHFFG